MWCSVPPCTLRAV
ncbi:hypothetical protein E2C01_080482 [Portunus trituberculatus]|uniref:Uncharacterized protein n=1 Tax=Portunus trituberculatus TaxID=210409 RepID=A0A5B7IYI2_PORTR|nr:hypothetical protein [Portunus trituberculatus]